MSYGMPKSYDSWRLASPPDDDHHKACPAHEDNEWPLNDAGIEVQPECKCADLDDDAKNAAAEARADRDEEMGD